MSIRDELDNKIIKTVSDDPGIRLSEISRRVSSSFTVTRDRILLLAIDGDLKIERGHGIVRVYPKEA